MSVSEIFRKWFDKSEEEVKRLWPIVEQVNSHEPAMEALAVEDFPKKTEEFKTRLSNGESLEDILPEAFALVREVSRRTLHMRHFDVQILGGIVLHNGKIAEMKTGEGKTLVATLPLYLNALTGRGAHLVTVNDYLARRDAVWMGPIFATLGMSVGVIQGQSADSDELGGSYLYTPGAVHDDPRYMNLVPCTRREAYLADITYGTNHEFGFDYLRDNMAFEITDLSMRELHYAIVDEVDSILIDEARTPHIISGASQEDVSIYVRVDKVVRRLTAGKPDEEGVDYTVNKKDHAAHLTDQGYEKIEEMLGIENLAEHPDLMHYVSASLKAHGLFEKDVEYVVREGQVVLVDENTGRLMFGRRLSDGLHQALEAKEGVQVQRESQTVAVITFQNLFRMYEKLAGMTGTAKTEEDEFRKIYGLEVVAVPTHRKMIRTDHPDVIYKTSEAKMRGIAKEILRLFTKQQPVLVGTRSIEMSERVSTRLMPDKLQILAMMERIRHHIENTKSVSKAEKSEVMKELLVPVTEAKLKSLAQLASKFTLPTNPLSDEMQDWLLGHFGLPSEKKVYLDEALKHGIPHNVLNAKFHEKEAVIISQAGRKGAVTIATNMAGRGVDILLGGAVGVADPGDDEDAKEFASETFTSHRRGGRERAAPPPPLDDQSRNQEAEECRELGGLFILGTERHESRRIDNQLRGRSGRQGDPGESRYFVSLEDQLWQIFNPKMMENPLLKAWPDLEQVDTKFLSSMIEKTQKRIELHFFEYRKHILEYDDVLNAQREQIYGDRREYLLGKDPRPQLKEYVHESIERIVESYAPDGIDVTHWDYQGIFRDVTGIFPVMDYGSVSDLESYKTVHDISDVLIDWADQAYEKKIAEFGDDFTQVERFVILRAITQKWTEHLQMIERLREGIGLRGYGQIDPLIAFRKESHDIFSQTLEGIRELAASTIFRVQVQKQVAPPPQIRRIEGESLQSNGAPVTPDGQIDWSKVKRNDPCPCGSGKKFKNCHYREVVS